MTFSDLVDQHIGVSVRKQLSLSDFLGKHSWQLDLAQPQSISVRRAYSESGEFTPSRSSARSPTTVKPGSGRGPTSRATSLPRACGRPKA